MQYFITFLEGITTFISPCILPLLPVYVSFFAGSTDVLSAENSADFAMSETEKSLEAASISRLRTKSLINASWFVLGFTLVFALMGAFAGIAGSIMTNYRIQLNIITGAIVIFFGLCYLDIVHLSLFNNHGRHRDRDLAGFPGALIFGMTFAISWSPCIGTFLGAALMLASQQASMMKGIVLLLLYSIGLGIPYILCAVLITRLKATIDSIKSHYTTINRICGILLIAVGIMMTTGIFDILLRVLN